MAKTATTTELAQQANAFLTPFQSIILSTVDEQGQAHSSYAPHLVHDSHLYIFVSALAKHSQTLSRGKANVFFIQDENECKNIFARKRLTLSCTVNAIENQSKSGQARLDAFEIKHGNTVGLLRGLPDIQLFELHPHSALYVTGFGEAFDLSDELSTLLPDD